ncbi:MAG: caspase family protein [Bacteroidetes bacterium]|nr:MAG: caspase family protein [Bacteroidota bacterium]
MKKVTLAIILLFAAVPAFSQKSNLIFFTENGQPFTLMMNGITYNKTLQTNVKIENLNPGPYSVNIKFLDTIYANVIDKIKLDDGLEVTYVVKYNANSDFDKNVKKLGKELFSTKPVSVVQDEKENIDKAPGKFNLAVMSKTKLSQNSQAATAAPNTPVTSTQTANNQTAPVTQDETHYRGSGDPMKGLNVVKAKEMVVGNYYAVIIGIDKYKGTWMPLKNAVNDAKAIETTLRAKYKFDYFHTLYNEQATRKSVITELEWLAQNAKPNDNVFIYYSGHGEYKQDLHKGFWVPVDAITTTTADYISNNDIQTYLSGIKSKHTLLVSDACFSGDIFRGNTISVPFEDSEKYYKEVHGLSSRQAMTSGGVEPVMDGGKNGHSVFAYYFLKSLNENESKFFDIGQLYNTLKIPVVNNSDQTPKLSPIKDTGDEGGQFIFIKK